MTDNITVDGQPATIDVADSVAEFEQRKADAIQAIQEQQDERIKFAEQVAEDLQAQFTDVGVTVHMHIGGFTGLPFSVRMDGETAAWVAHVLKWAAGKGMQSDGSKDDNALESPRQAFHRDFNEKYGVFNPTSKSGRWVGNVIVHD